MLEYSEAYLRENERILEMMDQQMSAAAVALAKQMASLEEQLEEEELEEAA